MDIESIRNYCISKKGVTESFPFDQNTLVFKVGEKMFAASNIEEEDKRINLKCDPERSVELRANHPEIVPGYHMNKKHWNTVYLNGSLKSRFILELIDHSYELVWSKLSAKVRAEL